MEIENSTKSSASVMGKISSSVGIVISIGVAVIALVVVLITNQVQDCTKSNDGFATVVYDISTRYAAVAMSFTNTGSDSIIEWFITSNNEEIKQSIKPGRYDIHQHYISSDQYEILVDRLSAEFTLPDQSLYEDHQANYDIGLCAGDEFHILVWGQP